MRTIRIRTARRITDTVGDVGLVVWGLVWLVLARSIRDGLDSLAQPIEQLGTTTGTMAERLDEAAGSLKEVAFVGEQLAAPFPGMASSIRNLANQLNAQVASLGVTSDWLVPLVFLVPTLIAAGLYIPWRIRRVQETAAARTLLQQNPALDLFAFRAMATSRLRGFLGVSPDPVAAWRAGDPSTIRRMAVLELRRVGLEFRGEDDTALTRVER